MKFQLDFSILFTSSEYLSLSLWLGVNGSICFHWKIGEMEDIEGEGDSVNKRPHMTTGNTPHKPDDKRGQSTSSVPCRSEKKMKLSTDSSKRCKY